LWTDVRDRTAQNGVWVPGGLAALAFIAQGKEKSTPERFFLDYCRTIRANTNVANHKIIDAYLETIREHFRLVAALEALGKRDGNQVKIVLLVKDKASQKKMEKVMNLLGWKMHASKKGVSLESGEKASQAKRQDTASAQAIDEV